MGFITLDKKRLVQSAAIFLMGKIPLPLFPPANRDAIRSLFLLRALDHHLLWAKLRYFKTSSAFSLFSNFLTDKRTQKPFFSSPSILYSSHSISYVRFYQSFPLFSAFSTRAYSNLTLLLYFLPLQFFQMSPSPLSAPTPAKRMLLCFRLLCPARPSNVSYRARGIKKKERRKERKEREKKAKALQLLI